MLRPTFLRDILGAYVLLVGFRVVPRLNIRNAAKRNLQTLHDHLLSAETLRHICFAVTLPRVYMTLKKRYPGSSVHVVLSAPLFYLLQPSLRKTVVTYVATLAAVNFRRGSKIRRMLPPMWTLLVAANSWLLWAFLFKRHLFPKGYGNLIIRHSGYGSKESADQLVRYLAQTKFDVVPPGILSTRQLDYPITSNVHAGHTRAVCARLHPETLSCSETYIKAWIAQFPQVFRWVALFNGLSLIFRRKKVMKSPKAAIRNWVISSTRGTAFIVGAINTCWGLTCLLQRLLKPGQLPRLRWIINGLLGNLWVLVLPQKRRTDFALYTARLAIVSCLEYHDSCSLRLGELLLLIISWRSLLMHREEGKGTLELAGTVMDYLDSYV